MAAQFPPMTPPDRPAPPLLEARGLRFTRNDEPVFGPLDFSVNAGEALLVQDHINVLEAPRRGWQYLPGQRRVKFVPERRLRAEV